MPTFISSTKSPVPAVPAKQFGYLESNQSLGSLSLRQTIMVNLFKHLPPNNALQRTFDPLAIYWLSPINTIASNASELRRWASCHRRRRFVTENFMNKLIVLFITAILVGCGGSGASSSSSSSSSGDAANGRKLCDALIQSGALDCEVKVFNLSIDATMRTSHKEARKICSGITSQMAKYASFKNLKTLNIYYPKTSSPLASCTLH